jgi:hypothetical protein
LSTPAIKTLENSGSGITKTEMEIRKLYFEKFKKIKKNKKNKKVVYVTIVYVYLFFFLKEN